MFYVYGEVSTPATRRMTSATPCLTALSVRHTAHTHAPDISYRPPSIEPFEPYESYESYEPYEPYEPGLLSQEELAVTAEIVQWLDQEVLPVHVKLSTLYAVEAVSDAELRQDSVAADALTQRLEADLRSQAVEAGAYSRIVGLISRMRSALRRWRIRRYTTRNPIKRQ